MRKIRGKRPISRRVRQSGQTVSLAKPKRQRETKRISRPYTQNPDSQYLTQSEVQKLFSVITSPRDRAWVRLAFQRGLRAHEVGLLQLSDWNERDGLLHVRRGKGSISRDYRITPAEATALRAWLKIRGREPGPLFPSRQKRAGTMGIHRSQLDRLFRRYCQAAGIRSEKQHLHVLKHTAGTRLAEQNNPADVIKDWLGHVSLKNSEIYTHFSQRRRDEAYERNKDWRW